MVFNDFNNFHADIKFTLKRESEREINFLNIKLTKMKRSTRNYKVSKIRNKKRKFRDCQSIRIYRKQIYMVD